MRCPDCGNTNAPDAKECEFCGQSLRPAADPKRATVLERAPAVAPDPVKRRTVYEPPAAAGRPAAPLAPDPFSQPPPRRAVHDAQDPFRAAMTQAPANPPPVAPPPVAPPTLAPLSEVAPPKHPTLHQAASARRPLAVVLVQANPADPGVVVTLREGRNVVGRDEGCEVRLADGRVSSQHAFFFATAAGVRFIDVSTNGSLVDGEAVHGMQVDLRPGAVLVLGGTRLICTPLAPAPPEPWETA